MWTTLAIIGGVLLLVILVYRRPISAILTILKFMFMVKLMTCLSKSLSKNMKETFPRSRA